MADKKISQLSAATAPLVGTEVLPIVQSGATVKVSVDNLTAGKSVSAASFVPTSATVPTNGIFLGAANSVSVATNSTEHWMVNASGNLNPVGAKGIGTDAAPVSEAVATTFSTSATAAGSNLSGSTLAADGTDTNININITPKGTGEVVLPKVNVDGGTIDGTIIGGTSAAAGSFTLLNANNAVAFNGGSFTFNDNGANLDFRCEGDTDTNLFFIDASADSIGVGTNVPGGKIDVRNAGGSSAYNLKTSASNIANPNNTGSEIIGAQVSVGTNIIFSERQVTGAFADRCELAVVTNTGFGLGFSEKVRLTSGGEVGVGVTSVTAGAKVEIAGAVRTSAPAGGTAANWKLGTVHTVSPTSPNRTIEVDIGGTIYYLHAKTTND